MCEIGFNAGHSAILWLESSPHLKYLGFDLGVHHYSKMNLHFFESRYSADRFRVIFGPSNDTVPRFVAENPSFRCDILSIDGGHELGEAAWDLINMRAFVDLVSPRPPGPQPFDPLNGTLPSRPLHRFHVALIDDVNCGFKWCVGICIQYANLNEKCMAVAVIAVGAQ